MSFTPLSRFLWGGVVITTLAGSAACRDSNGPAAGAAQAPPPTTVTLLTLEPKPLEQASEVPTNDDAEATAADQEAAQRLTLALGELDPRDRLLLAYRFEQDLTFDQIARLMDLGDAFRARRHVQAALDRLSAVFEKK